MKLLKYKSLRFDQNELLYLLMLTEDDLEDLKESLRDSTDLSVEDRADFSLQLSYSERLYHRFRDALQQVDPALLLRHDSYD